MIRQILSYSSCTIFAIMLTLTLQNQAQDVSINLSDKLSKSVALKFIDRDIIGMTNTFYETIHGRSNEAMYLSLHVVLEDRRNGEVYASFILPPSQRFVRIQLKKEITPRTVDNIDVQFFYNNYSATYDMKRIYWEIKQSQFEKLLWESLQLYFSRDKSIYETLFKYFSEAFEKDEYRLPPNPVEFLESLSDFLSNPDFNKLPSDIQYKIRFITDKANDPQYIKGITYNLKDTAQNLEILKVTSTIIIGAAVQYSGFSSSSNSGIINNFGLSKLPFTLRGMVGLPTEHRIKRGVYGRFYLSGFYEQVSFKAKSTTFVGSSYILDPIDEGAYGVLGQTNFNCVNYGVGLTYSMISKWFATGILNFKVGIARVNGKIDFSETSLENGLTLKSKEFDALETSDNFAPYWEIDAGAKFRRSKYLRINFSVRVIYSKLSYKKDFELYRDKSFNKFLLGNRIASIQLGLDIGF